jgi:hypothetical protein
MGALLGYLIATASTYSSRPRVTAFSHREAVNEDVQSDSYSSKMGPLLETSKTDGEPQAQLSEAQALDFRNPKPLVSDVDQPRKILGTNMSS